MLKTKWMTLGAAAALFAAMPALASDPPCPCCEKSGDRHAAAKPPVSRGVEREGRKVEVSVTKDGFVPAEIPARKGEVLNLVVTRKIDRTCATELVQREQGVNAPLPLDEPVTVTLKAPDQGQLRFSCAHGHIAGTIVTR